VLIIRRSKLYHTASGTTTPAGGRPVHRLRENSLNLCTGRSPTVATTPDAAQHNPDLFMMMMMMMKIIIIIMPDRNILREERSCENISEITSRTDIGYT